jgi:ELWxxDGT repeat protein
MGRLLIGHVLNLQEVTDITAKVGTQFLNESGGEMIDVNGTLFFITGEFGEIGLWKSDGTEAGTVQVTNGVGDGISLFSPLSSAGGMVFFSTFNIATGDVLWKSDGTEAGTAQVKALSAFNMSDFNGTLYFHGGTIADGSGLWKSDGTEAGTTLVKAFPAIPLEFDPDYIDAKSSNIVTTGNQMFFVRSYWTTDGSYTGGLEVWSSDGTEAGTSIITQITEYFPDDIDMKIIDGKAFFKIAGQLWQSDGTEAGTTQIIDLRSDELGEKQVTPESNIVKLGDDFFFGGYTGSFEDFTTVQKICTNKQ